MGPRACLEGRKISSPPGFDPGPSARSSIAIPTKLPGSYKVTNVFAGRGLHLNLYLQYYIIVGGAGDGAVGGALRYKPEGRGFDSRRCVLDFLLTSFRPNSGPGVDSACNRNEYQDYFLG